MIDILCIGLMVCDLIIKPVDKSIFDVDSISLDGFDIAAGGDALNASINLANLGINTSLIGKVGNDFSADFLINKASKSGVNVEKIIRTNQYTTSTSVVMIDKDSERHFAYYGKCNNDLGIDDIDTNLIKQAKIVHVGSAMALEKLDGNGIAELFKIAKKYGKTTSMDVTWDSSGLWLEKIKEALYYTDIFLPSYEEAKMISNKEDLNEIKDYFKQFNISTFGIKLGSKGCYVTDFKEEHYIKAKLTSGVVDTTGAGDAFVSGFLAGMIKGLDIYNCGRLGSDIAAKCITKIGATTWTEFYDNNLDNDVR